MPKGGHVKSSPDADDGDRGDAGRVHLERIEELAEKHIGELLVEAGLIGAAHLEEALRLQVDQGGDAVQILISHGYLDVNQFLAFLADQPIIHKFDFSQYETDPSMLQLVPRAFAERHEVFPIDREGEHLTLGIVRPLSQDAFLELEAHAGVTIKPILCSAQDIHAAIERYYSKPAQLSAEVELRGLEAPMKLSRVARLVREINSFPALPETVQRVRTAMSSPRSSIRDVGDIIVMDPPIAAKVLSVANSAAYGFPRQIQDINLAITLLGLRETYSIVLSAAILNLLEKSRHIDYKRFWIEALCCAAATRFVLKASRRRQLTSTFVAGLLHDIGRLALAEVAPALYGKIDRELAADDLIAAEQQVLGLSHAEAGYELAVYWELPPEIAEPIRFHHHPAEATQAKEQVAVVALADALSRAKGATLKQDLQALNKHAEAMELLGMDAEQTEAMIDEFLSRRDETLRDALN